MTSVPSPVIGAGLCLLALVLSGHWLKRLGRPHNGLVSTLHKLTGLGGGVLIVLTVRQMHRVAPLTALELTLVVITGLLFVALVATGAILTRERPMEALVQRTHKIVPYLAVISAAVTLYLLLAHR